MCYAESWRERLGRSCEVHYGFQHSFSSPQAKTAVRCPLYHRTAGTLRAGRSRPPSGGPCPAALGRAGGRGAGIAVRPGRPARRPAGGHHRPVGPFHPAVGTPGPSPAARLRAGGQLPQPVQSLDHDSLPAAGLDARAAGGVQPPGTAHCHPGGRGAAGRTPHRELGRHRRGRAGRGRGRVHLPAGQRRAGAGAVSPVSPRHEKGRCV